MARTSVPPGKSAEVGVSLLQESVAALLGLVRHIAETGRLAREDLLSDQTIIDHVEGELQHPLGIGALLDYLVGPLQCDLFQIFMRDHLIDHPHLKGLLRRVAPPHEEDLPRSLLTDHPGQIGRPVTRVIAGHVGVRLLEGGVFLGGKREIANNMETVSATDSPTRDNRNNHFGHESDEALHLENMEAAETGRIDGVGGLAIGVLVTVFAPDPLIAAGTECPTTVLWRRPIAGEEDASDISGLTSMVEGFVEFIDGVGAKGVPDLGAVERHPHGTGLTGTVIGDVGEVESGHDIPGF